MSQSELIDFMIKEMANGHCKNQIIRFPDTGRLMLQIPNSNPNGILIGDLTQGKG